MFTGIFGGGNPSSSNPSRPLSRTPQYSPPPPEVEADLRKVRWGSNELFSQPNSPARRQDDPYASDDELEQGSGDEDDDDGPDAWRVGITLAVMASRGRLGCAYYDGETNKLLFLEDAEESGVDNWDLVNTIVEQTNPKHVLTAATSDPAFLAALQASLAVLSPDSALSAASSLSIDSAVHPIKLEFRNTREFNTAGGKAALTQVVVLEGGIYAPQEQGPEDEDDGMSEDAYSFNGRGRGRKEIQSDRAKRNGELRLESFVNGLEASPMTLGCVGALLGFLASARSAAGELDDSIQVAGLELMILEKVLHINKDALASLQIFSNENHASIHSDKTKEGLSLFGILNLARTPLGRALLRKWFFRPPLEIDVIESRHAAVECFLRNENQHISDAIQVNFRYIKNVCKNIRTIAMGKGGLKDWIAVWQFLYGAIMVRDSVAGLHHKQGVEIAQEYLKSFDPEVVGNLGRTINDVIDWEESGLQKHVCVKSGVYEDLDELRRTYHGLPSLLNHVAIEIGHDTSTAFAESLSVVYFPQLGYLITIPFQNDGTHAPPVMEGWEYQFVTEEQVYYKNDKCRDLDEHLGDIHSFIVDKEIEIMHVLLDQVLALEPQFIHVTSYLSELDCLLAFAEAARIYDWNRPVMSQENVTRIQGGRHPLVELCVDSFVRNDTFLVGSKGVEWDYVAPGPDDDAKPEVSSNREDTSHSMIIITGANYSGKSIYLKQIALITFMAHVGSFVPAENAVIGLTDRILVRISTVESITRGSSAFMIDLQQISFALRNATSRSLIVIDEFGKGTDSNDGAGLFWGAIEHLIRHGPHTPRIAVATHFSHVLANKLISPAFPISYAHMEIVIQPATTLASTTTRTTSLSSSSKSSSKASSSSIPEVTYLYRLSPGLSPSSHATSCALQFGIAPETLARASFVSHLVATFDIAALLNADLDDEERRELEETEAVARRFLEWPLEEEQGDDIEEVLKTLRRVLGKDA